MGKINAAALAAELSAIRNVGNHDREDCKTKVLHCLKYTDDKSVSIPEFDAFLVKVISERFGVSANRDIILMAFGLLEGYHYEEINETENRRDKYLTDSNHQQTRARKKEPYVGASDKRKKALRGNLRKMEDGLIESLADYLAEQVKNDDSNDVNEEYVKRHISPIAIPQPIYILTEDESESVSVDDKIRTDSPAEISKQGDVEEKLSLDEPEPSMEMPPVDEPETPRQPPPQQNITYISSDTINNGTVNNGTINHVNMVVESEPHINIHRHRQAIPIFAIIVVAVVGFMYFKFLRPAFPPVEEILVTDSEIELVPNERQELGTAVLPPKANGVQLSYTSSDPSIVRVSSIGMLQAAESHANGGIQTADITIQAESGATKIKTVAVNFSESGYDTPDGDIDNFVPPYRVEQRVRLAGTNEWKTNVENVKVGDLIEFRIKYTNTSDETQNSVMIKNILPDNLHYVPDSTVLTNAAYTLDIDQKTITTTGINIGHYEPGANAYVDFKAKVVDITLQDGSNTLVNWSQCGVGSVTLQDYTTVQLYMEK